MDRGMFGRLTHLLRQDAAPNVLAVLVRVPTNPVNHASPTYISSAGWDWMPYVPRLLGGIPTTCISPRRATSLVDPWVRTSAFARAGRHFATTELEANHSAAGENWVVRGVIRPGDITSRRDLKNRGGPAAHRGRRPREFSQLTVDDPALWWPNGMATKNLYTCELTCEVDGEVFRPADGDIRHPGVFLRFREGRVPALGQRERILVRRQRGCPWRRSTSGCARMSRPSTAARWYQPFRAVRILGQRPWVNAIRILVLHGPPAGLRRPQARRLGPPHGRSVRPCSPTTRAIRSSCPSPSGGRLRQMLDKHFFGNSAGNARPTRYSRPWRPITARPRARRISAAKGAASLNIEVNKAMYEVAAHLWNDVTSLTWMSFQSIFTRRSYGAHCDYY